MPKIKLNLRQIILLTAGTAIIFVALLYHLESHNQLLEKRIAEQAGYSQKTAHSVASSGEFRKISDRILSMIEETGSTELIDRKINTVTTEIINSREHQRVEVEFTGKYDRIFNLVKSIADTSNQINIAEWSMNSVDIYNTNPNIRVRMVLMVIESI